MQPAKQPRYYIRDCFDKIVGNPLGYLTYTEASQAQMNDSSVMVDLWIAYEKKQLKDCNWVRIGSIRLG